MLFPRCYLGATLSATSRLPLPPQRQSRLGQGGSGSSMVTRNTNFNSPPLCPTTPAVSTPAAKKFPRTPKPPSWSPHSVSVEGGRGAYP